MEELKVCQDTIQSLIDGGVSGWAIIALLSAMAVNIFTTLNILPSASKNKFWGIIHKIADFISLNFKIGKK